MLTSSTSGELANFSCSRAIAAWVCGQTSVQQEKKKETTQTLPRSCSRRTTLPCWSVSLNSGNGPRGVRSESNSSARAVPGASARRTTATATACFMVQSVMLRGRGHWFRLARPRLSATTEDDVRQQHEDHHHTQDHDRHDQEIELGPLEFQVHE